MKLRELLVAATSGPWGRRFLIEITEADSDLCDYLRNNAEKYLALIDAAKVLLDTHSHVAFEKLDAALKNIGDS